MGQEITYEIFTSQVNKTFRIETSAEPLELKLSAVELNSRPRSNGLRQPFTLLFQGLRNRLLPEGLYRVENDEIGSLGFYIIPIISAGEHQNYQVVFN